MRIEFVVTWRTVRKPQLPEAVKYRWLTECEIAAADVPHLDPTQGNSAVK